MVLKEQLTKPQLFPNQEVYQNQEDFPVGVQEALDNLDLSLFSEEEAEQQKAKETLQNWAETLWHGMVYLARHMPEEDKSIFRQDYADKLAEFVAHPDHGITHSYYVYHNANHLVEIDGQDLSENQDAQLQLLALTHDVMQILPFSMPEKTSGKLAEKNQKDEHARIIAALARMYGRSLGFDKQTTASLSFGLRKHDSTYDNQFYPNGELGYLSKVLHDSDKLFGASMHTDAPRLVSGGLKRNHVANIGVKGGYLIRTDLDAEYRGKLKYGDRCFSDSVAVVFRELGLPMYTEAGKKVDAERLDHAPEQMQIVYGEIFDEANNLIFSEIIPRLQNQDQSMRLFSSGMDQEKEPVTIQTEQELESLIDNLYNRELVLSEKYKRNGYQNSDARGWKLFAEIDGQTHAIDPSVARFCFQQDGKEVFFAELKKAFDQQFPDLES